MKPIDIPKQKNTFPEENYPVSLPASNSGANAAEGLHCKVSCGFSKDAGFTGDSKPWPFLCPGTFEGHQEPLSSGHVFSHHPQKGHQQNCQEDEDWQFDIFYWWPKSSFQVVQVALIGDSYIYSNAHPIFSMPVTTKDHDIFSRTSRSKPSLGEYSKV